MKIVITLVYSGLLAWGFAVGVQQIYQGYRRPEQLLNPLFSNRVALQLFVVHIAVVTLDLFVIGPWAVDHKSAFWYWGGRIALFTSAMPLGAFMNRTAQSFGGIIGKWVVFRNAVEFILHIVVAAMAINWFHYYLLLWWLVAYRYLDVGPRRVLQKLYNTPEKLAVRPWAPLLNLAVIVALYALTFVVVFARKITYAVVPADNLVPHTMRPGEIFIVVAVNVGLALFEWISIRKYTDSIATGTGTEQDARTQHVP